MQHMNGNHRKKSQLLPCILMKIPIFYNRIFCPSTVSSKNLDQTPLIWTTMVLLIWKYMQRIMAIHRTKSQWLPCILMKIALSLLQILFHLNHLTKLLWFGERWRCFCLESLYDFHKIIAIYHCLFRRRFYYNFIVNYWQIIYNK